jgi:myo-inositol-1(or 4)-monophosphatase
MAAELSSIIEIAYRAGEKLAKYFHANDGVVRLKQDRTLVTEADLAADRLITQALIQQFPSDGILSEEMYPYLPAKHERVWIVDPLDGTTNFSIGLPIWGVSIARVTGGFPDLAVVYFPLQKELLTAEKGKGAWLNDRPLHVLQPDREKPAAFFSCCSRTHRYYDVSIRYKPRILGSACYSMSAVARGMALIAFEATPKLWDLAATWLIIQESGGVIETYDGSEPFPVLDNLDYRCKDFPTLSAATPQLMAYARQNIRRKSNPAQGEPADPAS